MPWLGEGEDDTMLGLLGLSVVQWPHVVPGRVEEFRCELVPFLVGG